AEDGIRDATVTGVQTCALPISKTTTTESGTRRVTPTPSRPSTARINATPEAISAIHTASPLSRTKVFLSDGTRPPIASVTGAREIGRASCRERVEGPGGEEAGE